MPNTAERKVVSLSSGRGSVGEDVRNESQVAENSSWSAARTLVFVMGLLPLAAIAVPLFFIAALSLICFHVMVCVGLMFAGYQLNVWDVIEAPAELVDHTSRQFTEFIERATKRKGDPLSRQVR